MLAALYHTITLLNEFDCYNTLYGDTGELYVINREISGVSGYVKGQDQGHQKHEMH